LSQLPIIDLDLSIQITCIKSEYLI